LAELGKKEEEKKEKQLRRRKGRRGLVKKSELNDLRS